jgi:hypothetical protein
MLSRLIGIKFSKSLSLQVRKGIGMDRFQNAAPGRLSTMVLGNLTKSISRWSWISRKFIVLSQSLDFVKWVQSAYKTNQSMTVNREGIWQDAIQELSDIKDSGSLLVLEFGVAWGYATNYFMSRFPNDMRIEWFAFDRFTGLPRQWRDHEAGAFDAQGVAPDIDDSRVTFEVGDVEETLKLEKHILPFKDRRKLILFDLDLFEPSLFAWNLIEPYLRSGDILYFDEAFDQDERELLIKYVNKSSLIKFELFGYSHLALCIKVL